MKEGAALLDLRESLDRHVSALRPTNHELAIIVLDTSWPETQARRAVHRRAFCVIFVASLAAANAAFACEPTPYSHGPWLGSNKPVQGKDVKLKSPFGMVFHPLLKEKRMHTGVDWAADLGTPIRAAAGGEVVAAERRGTYGNIVLIDHGSGHQTLYAHLLEFSVSPGNCVEFGTVIGKVGATGLVAGPLLHFEVHENGQPVDPLAVPTRQSAQK